MYARFLKIINSRTEQGSLYSLAGTRIRKTSMSNHSSRCIDNLGCHCSFLSSGRRNKLVTRTSHNFESQRLQNPKRKQPEATIMIPGTSLRLLPRRTHSGGKHPSDELCGHEIERLILTLAHLTGNNNEKEMYLHQYQGFAHQHEDGDSRWGTEELNDIIDTLQALLDAAESLNSSQVIEVHTMIGKIHQALGNSKKAAESFLKALWVRKHSSIEHAPKLQLEKHSLTISKGAA